MEEGAKGAGIYTLLTLQDTDTGELLGCMGGVGERGQITGTQPADSWHATSRRMGYYFLQQGP